MTFLRESGEFSFLEAVGILKGLLIHHAINLSTIETTMFQFCQLQACLKTHSLRALCQVKQARERQIL